MYTVKHGGDIHRGDLIAVSNGYDFSIGIYYGRGSGSTVQYYTPSGVVESKSWWEKYQTDKAYAHNGKPWGLTRIWKSFINTPRETRILKLNRENITDEQTIKDIIEAKEILKQFNIPVNY
jgi:hypothetical protein